MNVIVFEDRHVERLHPITLGRPAYAITCGSFRLIDWLRMLDYPLNGLVRPHLTQLQQLDYPDLGGNWEGRTGPLLLVNARLVPSGAMFENLKAMLETGRAGAVRSGDDVATVLLTREADALAQGVTTANIEDYFAAIGISRLETFEASLPLFEYPHDVIRHNLEILTQNLEYRLADGSYRQLDDGVFAAAGATIGQHVVTDVSKGPILLDENAQIGPFSLLHGPAYVGRSSKLIEHAAVKDAVSIGHTAKIGGEVEASVIEPYTNKQHHGFLGHSYLGSWINLGAGTCNSDLKNTYGNVNIDYRGQRVATGMQFVGCIMGDYAKTAINTGIFTGKIIGACSMLYGFVTTNVPSFVNYARLFGQATEMPPEVMVATQQRMFARRDVSQRPCDIQLMHEMYELTRMERQLAGEPLAL